MFMLLAGAVAAPPTEVVQEILAIELRRGSPSQLSALAADANPEVRARAALALGRLRDPEGLGQLQTLVADPNVEVRHHAAFALGLVPGGEDVARAALADEADPEVRTWLFAALALHGTGLEALTTCLGEEEAEVATACAQGLGRLAMAKVEGVDDPAVIAALMDQLDRLRYPALRRASAFALGRMAPEVMAPVQVTELLRVVRRDHDPTVRSYLVRAGAKVAGDPLLQLAVDDYDGGVRIAAARAMAARGEAPPELLARLLADTQWSVRMAAIQATGSLEVDHEALLTPFTRSGEVDLAAAAVGVLVNHGVNPRPWLDPKGPVIVQVAAISGLTKPDQLVRLATLSKDAPVRTAAASQLNGLEGVTGEHARALLASTDQMVVAVGMTLLGELGDPESADAVGQAMLGSAAVDVQLEGLKALTTLGLKRPPESVVKAVKAAQLHPSIAVRVAAAPLAETLGLPAPPPMEPQPIPDYAQVLGIVSARILTDAGELRVRLHPELAPMTVHNFATLAEQDYFDGLAFHRVVPDFVVQDGCPRGDGWGGPGYSIPDELSWLPYDEGVLGMALGGPDTGGSQWFLTLSPQPHLDAGYTVFGELDVGAGTLRSIHQGTVIQDVIIERVGVPAKASGEPSSQKSSPDGR